MYINPTNSNQGMSNKSITRIIAFNTFNSNGNLIKQFVLDFQQKIMHFWDKNAEQLKEYLGTSELPHVRLKLIDMITVRNGEEHLRVILTDDQMVNIKRHEKVSHLVKGIEIVQGSDACDRVNSDDFEVFDLTIPIKTKPQIEELICNVMYDIVLFQWNGGHIKFPEMESIHRLNALKVEFCKEKGLLESDSSLKFVNFGMYCRENGVMNCKLLVDYWDEFIKFIDIRSDSYDRISYSKENNNELARIIISKHPKGKQISERKLAYQLSHTNADRFLVIRTERKPRSPKLKKRLFSVLGIKKWKTGIIRVKKYEEQYNLTKLTPCISIFVVER